MQTSLNHDVDKQRTASHPEVRMGRADSETDLNWTTTGFMLLFHAGAIAALFFFSWTNLIVALVLYIFAINMGIGMGYHRLLTHRGYRVPKWVEYFLAVCGTLSLEGGPIAGLERIECITSTAINPATRTLPQEGTWWSHVGWIISGRALHSETVGLARYVPDLTKNRFHVWISKYHWIPLVSVGVALLVLGTVFGGIKTGIGLFLWGIFLRTTLGLHATWLVNSATHLHGKRRFETRDDSRNSWWVALLTGGEGWHNNHHANPVSSRHGLAWYEFDPNYYGIWVLKKLGIAKNVQIAKFIKRSEREPGKITEMTSS